MPKKIVFPLRGATNAAAYIDQPGDTSPLEAIRNVRPNATVKDRPRGGQRPSIVKTLDFDFGDEFQAMEVISRASFVTGYQETNCTAVGGVTHVATALQGQVWWFKPNLSMFKDIYDAGGNGTESVPAIAVSKTQPRMAYAFTTNSGPNQTVKIVAYNPGSPADPLWTAIISEVGVNRFVNTIEFGRSHLFVTTNDEVVVFDAMTGVQVFTEPFLGSGGDELAKEVVEARTWIDTSGKEYLFAAFDGKETGSIAPNTGETIQSGDAASMFRSGVAKFLVAGDGSLAMQQYGVALPADDPWWEYLHKTFRVSEHTQSRPHGCWINALAVGPDGSVFVGRTNQGWGPNTNYLVNGSQQQYVTVFKINPFGEMEWERDTDSSKNAGYDTGNNDIPSVPHPDPSVMAVAVDSGGNVYAAGRRNASGVTDGANAFYLDGSSGDEFWRQNLSGTIRQAAIFIDPTDDNCWFAGDRNSDWTGSDGEQAHLWKTAQFGGAVLRFYDLNEPVSALGVCVDSQTGREGRIMYVTDYIS